MGYSIKIGNASIWKDINEDGNYGYVGMSVDTIELPNAPDNNDYNAKMNLRTPSYVDWSDFCREVGLYNIFFNLNTGLMHEHPGNALLTNHHLTAFKDARENYIKQHPTAKAVTFVDTDHRRDGFRNDEEAIGYNINRLDWLIFWTEWALNNCEFPIIYNT